MTPRSAPGRGPRTATFALKLGPDVRKEGEDLAERTRPNALFLSVAAQWDGKIATALLGWFRALHVAAGVPDPETSQVTLAQPRNGGDEQAAVVSLIRSLDLGIEDLRVEEATRPKEPPPADDPRARAPVPRRGHQPAQRPAGVHHARHQPPRRRPVPPRSGVVRREGPSGRHAPLLAREFKVRNDASFEKDYILGKFGAIPFLGGLVREAVRLRDGSKNPYNQVWCVFDRDSFLPRTFNAALALAASEKIRVAYSNEAFESDNPSTTVHLLVRELRRFERDFQAPEPVTPGARKPLTRP